MELPFSDKEIKHTRDLNDYFNLYISLFTEQRKAEAAKIRGKYPDRIPVSIPVKNPVKIIFLNLLFSHCLLFGIIFLLHTISTFT